MDARHAGSGYLAMPQSNAGPGVLVLHGWWGLTPFFRGVCDRLADAGFIALAPDLLDGATADTVDAAEAQLAAADANALAHLTRSSLATLRAVPGVAPGRVGIVGFSMGASLGLWLSGRVVDEIAATVAFYGGQETDLQGSTSAYLGHFAEHDPYVDADELVLLEADLHLLDLAPTFHHYPGTHHWFAEDNRPEYDADAAALAWDRTLAFLRQHLPT